ncbi:hypothetical protein FACS189452_09640 [Bacteroidia bacterium]|nr:hypothetical protein FACS189452_09640 [Bacteroidia bacterium]GHT81918.1 hypothetical protein FACS189467_6710 [Bacteroidia bacterium]
MNCNLKLGTFVWRVAVCHTVTYFVMGIIFSTLFNYGDLFTTDIIGVYMRPITSKWVALGPVLNIVRGVMFGFILWVFRDTIICSKYAWLKTWGLFVALAILGTAGAAPCSMEGVIYTNLPLSYHLGGGLLEMVLQTLAFSLLLFYWHKKPRKIWNITMGIAVGLIVLMGLAAMLVM